MLIHRRNGRIPIVMFPEHLYAPWFSLINGCDPLLSLKLTDEKIIATPLAEFLLRVKPLDVIQLAKEV